MKKLFRSLLAACLFTGAMGNAQASLVAFYNFEGNANDVSGNGKNGTVFGAVLGGGYQGQAYSFDGINDFISLPVDINPLAMPRLTMGAWVRTDTTVGIRGVISHDNGGYDRNLNMDWRGNGSGYRWSAFTGSGVVSAGPDPVITQTWTFVAARYDDVANTVVLNVDGAQAAFSANPGTGLSTTAIGRNPSFNEFFDGLIDNVFIYDELLSDARINEIRAGGARGIVGSVAAPSSLALLVFGLPLLALSGRRGATIVRR